MSATQACVRMYNQQNLGDCFLLKFSAGGKESYLLIDFGSYEGNTANEIAIAKHIRQTIGDAPLYIALTHQHKDHLSGFVSAAEALNKPKALDVPQLWLTFLDDDNSEAAKKVTDVSKKYWQSNAEIKKLVKKKMGKHVPVQKLLSKKEGLDIFSEAQIGGEAISNLKSWAKDIKFLAPGDVFDFPGLPAHSVRVHVLGPPDDFALISRMDPNAQEKVNGLDQLMQLDTSSSLLLEALQELDVPGGTKNDFPFSRFYQAKTQDKRKADPKSTAPADLYAQTKQSWRRIDYDWLSEMGHMALHMDQFTNNSSLVLAFELVDSGKVLLFAGDAQIGNWSSWFDVKFKGSDTRAEDLLKRTVFYKAGHHSSDNATLAKSLNLMNEKELVIFIPVNEKVSKKHGFHMLMPPMMKGYNRKAQGRVVRSDKIFHTTGKNVSGYKYPFAKSKADFKGNLFIASNGKGPELFIEHTVE